MREQTRRPFIVFSFSTTFPHLLVTQSFIPEVHCMCTIALTNMHSDLRFNPLPIVTIFSGLLYNETHVHQHVGYSIRVGLGHYFNIYVAKEDNQDPTSHCSGVLAGANCASRVSKRSANTKFSGSGSCISMNSSNRMHRSQFYRDWGKAAC